MTMSYCDLAGIWIRDIRFKSNVQMTQVNKILKNLESKKLIKAVKSVAVSKIMNSIKSLVNHTQARLSASLSNL